MCWIACSRSNEGNEIDVYILMRASGSLKEFFNIEEEEKGDYFLTLVSCSKSRYV